MRGKPRKHLHEYTADERRAYFERKEQRSQALGGRSLTLRKMREFYESLRPEIANRLMQQLELMRGNPEWEDPEMWFPAWDEDKADEAFLTIKTREAFDPQLFRARVWARDVRKKDNPKAYQLNKCLDRWLRRCLEILDEAEWQDLTLLAIAVTAWNYFADELIAQYEECSS